MTFRGLDVPDQLYDGEGDDVPDQLNDGWGEGQPHQYVDGADQHVSCFVYTGNNFKQATRT